MILSSIFSFVLLLAVTTRGVTNGVLAVGVRATVDDEKRFCNNPLRRQEWRTLTSKQKAQYIGAVKCLQKLPAKSPFKSVKTRFDDFQGLHINLTDEIHLVGQFLPWHRRFLKVYETSLREECGYTGAHPYWNWSLDVDNTNTIVHSPVFDPATGFGGNGINVPGYAGPHGNLSVIPGWTGGGCITDGPFANYNLSLGPGTAVTNHCLQRGFNQFAPPFLNSTSVANTMAMSTFETFRIELEGTPITPIFKIHDGGHLAIGGEMVDRYSSPGDPLFYLHHANLDRIWWNWEQNDLQTRLTDISGRSTVDPPFTNVTLAFQLKMSNLANLVTIGDVMDIRTPLLCYNYV